MPGTTVKVSFLAVLLSSKTITVGFFFGVLSLLENPQKTTAATTASFVINYPSHPASFSKSRTIFGDTQKQTVNNKVIHSYSSSSMANQFLQNTPIFSRAKSPKSKLFNGPPTGDDIDKASTPETVKIPSESQLIDDSDSDQHVLNQNQPLSAKIGDIITIDLTLDPVGFVAEPLFDTHGTLTFILGWGNYLPGLHQLLMGLKVGDTRHNIPIDAGWGERRPELIATISKKGAAAFSSLDKVKVGMELVLQSGVSCVVTEVTEEYIVIDANPPLAGASYNCSVTVRNVESFPGNDKSSGNYHVATFALGCFWGAELAFMRQPGVVGTKVGYAQGDTPNPTYNDVCAGETGHTEAVRVVYDSTVISYRQLVLQALDRLGDDVYNINQVGNDVGTQYRSGIYYHSDEQKKVAESLLERLNGVQTEMMPVTVFYDAEDYHQQYLLKGGQSAKKGCTEYIRCYG